MLTNAFDYNRISEVALKEIGIIKKSKKKLIFMLTNNFSCNIIVDDSKRVSRSLKTEHERISEQLNAISKVKTKITKLRQTNKKTKT